jgi:mono/diheme cytochrome c family protein
LSAQQTADVVAFLNSGPKVQDIASLDTAQNPVAYTFTGADTTAGQTLYGTNCATCHGADGQTVGGSILGTYFSSDGKYSEGFHKLIYGDATGAMTRTAQGNLTAEQARDILAYIQANIPGTFPQN